jgi:hypothetical protein
MTYREVESETVDHHYSIDDAVGKGMVDEDSGTFHDPKTGEIMSLGAAVYEGYISPGSSPRVARFHIINTTITVDEPRFNSFLQTIFSTSLFIYEYTRGIIENSISYGSS